MPKLGWQILIAAVSGAMLLAGLGMVIWPDAAVRRKVMDFSEESTPAQSRWSARAAGCVLILFGLCGLWLVFVEGLKPWPPGEPVGV